VRERTNGDEGEKRERWSLWRVILCRHKKNKYSRKASKQIAVEEAKGRKSLRLKHTHTHSERGA